MLIKGEDADNIRLGDSFSQDAFDRDPDSRKITFDYMLAKPPFGVEWKQQQKFIEDEHRLLGHQGRFGAGLPHIDDGSLLFLQHMLSKMRAPQDGGSRIGIVFNGSPLFAGDAGGSLSNIRQWIIENGWLEAIVALPDQLFYNTGISTYIWILTNRKEAPRKGKIQLIDARQFFVKMRKSLGNKRNKVGDKDEGESDQIGEITAIYGNFLDGETRDFSFGDREKALVVSKVFDNEDFGYRKITVERPLRLNFQAGAERIARLHEQSSFRRLASSNKRDEGARQREIEAGRRRQEQIRKLVQALGRADGERVYRDREEFVTALRELDRRQGVRISAPELKAVLGAVGERDEAAAICRDRDGRPEPDSELRDTETVPLKEDLETYFRREVFPHLPDAWIDHSRTKVGYEVPFNRYFYVYDPPRPLAKIEADIRQIEAEIVALLGQIAARSGLISQTVTRGLPPDAARTAGLNPHPKLKPSGIEWIGDIPEHWKAGKIRRFARMRTGHTPSRQHPEYWEDCTIPWFTLADVWQLRDQQQDYLGETAEKISDIGLQNSAAELLPEGTVILSRTASVGFSGIMPQPMATSQDFWNWICGKDLLPKYLLYIFRAMKEEFNRLIMGSTHQTIYQSDAAALSTCVPPIGEQRTIVAFLDDETKKIDQMVAAVEVAISRLQEYRAALITAAITGKIDLREPISADKPAALAAAG